MTCEGETCSATNPVATMFYDGDGRLVKDLRNSNTTYNVRSSALGGEILTILNASGQKKQTHVYAGGSLIATQDASASPYLYHWRRDPHNTLSFAGSGTAAQMLDPLGVTVTPATALQIQQYWQNQYTPPGGYGNPNGVGYGPPASITSGTTCKADGGPLPCSMVLGWRNHEWAKEARVINNLAGGVDSRNHPQFIRHELPSTMTGVGIGEEDDEDDGDGGDDDNDGEVEQEVDQYPEVWYEVMWEQPDSGLNQQSDGYDKLRSTVIGIALFALLERPDCYNLIAGSSGKDPIALFEKLLKKNQFLEDTSLDSASVGGEADGTGEDAKVNMRKGYFREAGSDFSKIVYKGAGFQMTAGEYLAVYVLHELSHATGKFVHGSVKRGRSSSGKIVEYDYTIPGTSLNEEIRNACFGLGPI